MDLNAEWWDCQYQIKQGLLPSLPVKKMFKIGKYFA